MQSSENNVYVGFFCTYDGKLTPNATRPATYLTGNIKYGLNNHGGSLVERKHSGRHSVTVKVYVKNRLNCAKF